MTKSRVGFNPFQKTSPPQPQHSDVAEAPRFESRSETQNSDVLTDNPEKVEIPAWVSVAYLALLKARALLQSMRPQP